MTDSNNEYQDLSILYELSLAVGTTLDARENCRQFLHKLVNLKGLTYASVWRFDGSADSRTCDIYLSYPASPAPNHSLKPGHFIFEKLKTEPCLSMAPATPGLPDEMSEISAGVGAVAVFSLGEFGLLEIFLEGRMKPFSDQKLQQLESVIHKFGISLSGCLAHEKLMEETENRSVVQNALKRINKRYTDLFENIYDALIVLDADGNVTKSNRAARKMLGLDPDEKLSINVSKIIHPEDLDYAVACFEQLLRDGSFSGYEGRIITLKGDVRYVQVNSNAIFKKGVYAGSRNIVLDVTERKQVERRMKESEARLRQIIDSSLDAVVTIDGEGLITDWSRQAERFFGFGREEAIGQLLSELIIPHQHREAHHRGMIHFHKTGEGPVLNKHLEITALRKNGEEFPIELSIAAVKNEDGHFFNGFIRDITNRKVAQSKLHSAQVRLINLITNLQAGILLEDENRKIVLANRFFCEYFKIPAKPDELTGMDCSQAAEQSKHLFADPEGFVKGVVDVLEFRQLKVGEVLHMADGKILERDYIPLFADEKYLGHLWQYRDITERRKSQLAILKSEEKYRGIIENMELGLMEVDTNQTIVRAYQAFCEMTGYQAHELIGQNAMELFLPDNYADIMAQQDEVRMQGRHSVYEIQIRRKDGELIWVLISGAPIKDSDGNIVGSIGIHYDITDRKRLEHDLAEARRMADHARLTERQFLANMSHEIRTPMNAVIGMTHLLYETNPTQTQKVYLDSLRFAADSLLGIIDNILDLSKIEAGELEFEEKPFNLLQLMKSLQRTFQFKLRDKSIEIEMKYDPAIEYRVKGDSTRLNQILTNLLGNACKFTERGRINFSSKLLEDSPESYLVEFRVEDTGIGIPANKLDAIFENFKQANVKIARKYGGSGLGLTIVKQLVELQGGSIRVESRLGEGSSFIFTLPFKKSDIKISEKQQPYRIGRANVEALFSNLQILVVEDNLMNQKLITKILDIWRCDYQVANNGLEALEMSKNEAFDLILMDIHMPEMDGCEATEAIRQDEGNPNQNVPIIALTAAALLEEKKRAVKAGMSDFLTKPFSPEMLESCMLQHLHFNDEMGEMEEAMEGQFADEELTLNLDYLYEFSNNDRTFVLEMLDTFLIQMPANIEQLEREQRAENWEGVYKIVHTMKPGLMMLGMAEQHEKVMQIENMIKKGDFDKTELTQMLNWLAGCVRSSFPELERMREQV